jgi:hypothetical protein
MSVTVLNYELTQLIYIPKPTLNFICHKQVYIAIEGLEKSLGLDPNDPVVPFVLFLGTSATLWYECPFLHIGIC